MSTTILCSNLCPVPKTTSLVFENLDLRPGAILGISNHGAALEKIPPKQNSDGRPNWYWKLAVFEGSFLYNNLPPHCHFFIQNTPVGWGVQIRF